MPFTYIDATKKRADLDRMLQYSKGKREVPVIVEQGRVTIGFGGS